MVINESNYLWYLVGDVILVYVAAKLIGRVVDKIWFRYVDMVLEGQNQKTIKPKLLSGSGARYRMKNHSRLRAPGILLLLLAFLVGCAPLGPTPYQAADPIYGYAEQPRGEGLIEISFTGDPDTPFEFYTLYRAAELTVAQGNNGFEILNSSIKMPVRKTPAPSMRPRVRYPSHTPGRGIFFYESQPSQLRGNMGEQKDEFAYTASLVFRPFTAPSFPEGPLRYDARNVLKWLDRIIVRPRTNPR